MHEFTHLKYIMEKLTQISEQEGGARIAVVRVTIGALTHVSPSYFQAHFERAASGTVAQGADLVVLENMDKDDPLAQEIVLNSVDIERLEHAPASETIH